MQLFPENCAPAKNPTAFGNCALYTWKSGNRRVIMYPVIGLPFLKNILISEEEAEMPNRISVTIAGQKYTVLAEESEEYTRQVAERAHTKIAEAKAVTEAKAGKIEYRLDKTNIIHCVIGKVSFGAEKLQANFDALLEAIIKAKPAAAKGQYIKSCVVASTMGPGVKINPSKFAQ